MKQTVSILCLLCSLTVFSQSQNSLKAGTQIPFQYNLGYEYKFSGHFSANLQAGILTKPYDYAIINLMAGFGVDDVYINVLNSAFKFGIVGDLGCRYHFGKNYAGIYGQIISLTAQNTPVGLIETAFDVNINNYPRRRNQNTNTGNEQIRLKSQLCQLGIVYGRRFLLKNPKWEIHTEISVSKNVGSKTKATSEVRDITSLETLIDNELVPVYKDYAYVPSLNIYLVYKLGKN